jgi:biopolymer transport protein ExbD
MPLYPSKRKEKDEEDAELNITSLMDTFTIILVFLIRQFGTNAIEVAAGYRPPKADTRLAIDRIMSLQIREAGREAITYRIGDKPEKAERKNAGLGYQQLRADLKVEKVFVDAALADEALKGAINIVCDRQLAYSTLMDVMKSTAGAGFFKLKLIAQP